MGIKPMAPYVEPNTVQGCINELEERLKRIHVLTDSLDVTLFGHEPKEGCSEKELPEGILGQLKQLLQIASKAERTLRKVEDTFIDPSARIFVDSPVPMSVPHGPVCNLGELDNLPRPPRAPRGHGV